LSAQNPPPQSSKDYPACNASAVTLPFSRVAIQATLYQGCLNIN